MNIAEVIKCQWDGYTRYHNSRFNLWIHVIFVPVFIFAFVLFIIALITLDIFSTIVPILLMIISMGIQGMGHKKEDIPAEPFTSLTNVVTRILLEQLYTFPKFVLSRKFYSSLSKK